MGRKRNQDGKARGKGMGTLVLRGKKWVARWIVHGKVYTRSTKTGDKTAAEAKLMEYTAPFRLGNEVETLEGIAVKVAGRKAEIEKIENEKPAVEIEQGWRTYLQQPNRPDTGESTLRQYQFQFDAFSRWFRETHSQTNKDGNPVRWELRQVTQEDANAYATHLQKNVSPSTFNRHMNLLALVWRVLARTARLSLNPWKNVERKRHVVRSRRELTVEELIRVISAAQGEMKVLLALGIYAGLRLGDAACLDWSSVDMARNSISLIPMKTARRSQKRVTIPIHSTLFTLLAQTPPSSRKGPVLPELSSRYSEYDGALAKDVEKLFLSVDIKVNRNKLTASEKAQMALTKKDGHKPQKLKLTEGRASSDCGFHSLRHTFVSLCAAGGVPQSVVQSLVGHGNPAMTMRYTHVTLDSAQKAVALLPDVTEPKSPKESSASPKLAAILDQLDELSDKDILELIETANKHLNQERKTTRALAQ